MIESLEGVPFGHVALYNFQSGGSACEFGRVLRGADMGPSGGMTLASRALLVWPTSELKVERFFLQVFDNNDKAISLYERLGFTVMGTVALRRNDSGGITRWEKFTEEPSTGAFPDVHALRMETTAEQVHALARRQSVGFIRPEIDTRRMHE